MTGQVRALSFYGGDLARPYLVIDEGGQAQATRVDPPRVNDALIGESHLCTLVFSQRASGALLDRRHDTPTPPCRVGEQGTIQSGGPADKACLPRQRRPCQAAHRLSDLLSGVRAGMGWGCDGASSLPCGAGWPPPGRVRRRPFPGQSTVFTVSSPPSARVVGAPRRNFGQEPQSADGGGQACLPGGGVPVLASAAVER